MTQAHERTATLSQLVGKQIKLKLFLAEMSGRDLAGKLGVSPSWVSYRLSGKQEIGLNDMFQIAKALDIEVGELLTPEIIAAAADAGPRDIAHYFQVSDRTSDHLDRPRDNRPSGHPSVTVSSGPGRTARLPRPGRRRRD